MMGHSPHFLDRRSRAAFTLLEVLAASALLIVVLGIVLQIVSMTSQVTNRQLRRLDANRTVRIALDTLSQDIYTLVRQNGATLLFKPGDIDQSDALKFLCLCRPSPDQVRHRMSLITYEIGEAQDEGLDTSSIPALWRTSRPVSWPKDDDPSPEDYDFADVLLRSGTDRQRVAEGAFRLEILWMRRDGTITRFPSGVEDAQGFQRVDLARTIGFIATIAAVDRASQITAVSPDAFKQAKSTFVSLSEKEVVDGVLPRDAWNSRLAWIQHPSIRQNVFIMQRTYYLPR